MGGPEHLRVLHPQRDQLVDAEEPAVVELGAGQPPPGQPVVLAGEQLGERQALGARAQREDVVVVAQGVLIHLQLVEHRTESLAQHRQQDPAVVRGPVDVEPVRVGRLGTVPQHLPERGVQPFGDRQRHVVGDHVGDQPQPVLMGRGGEGAQGALAAELFADPGVVDRVVPVGGAGCRLQQRGQVQVGDAEPGQVRQGRGGVRERERGLQLEPVARCRGVITPHAYPVARGRTTRFGHPGGRARQAGR